MAQFGSDTFTGTEGDVLSTYSASWTLHTSTTVTSEIASGAVRGSAAGASMYYHSGTPANQDYSATADLIYKSEPTEYAAGPVVRMSTSAATFYFGRHANGAGTDAYQIYKFVAGTPTLLASSTYVLSANKTLKLSATGTTTTELVLYVDTVSTVTYSDASSPITAAGKAGIRLGYGGSNTPSDTTLYHLDNFSADDIVSGITGTIAVTIADFTSNIVGTTTIVGTIAQTLTSFTSNIVGTSDIVGNIAANTEDAIGVFSGTAGIVGTIESSFASFTGDLIGTTTVVGNISTQMEDTLSNLTGTTTIVGTITTTSDDVIMTANGFVGSAPINRQRTLVGMGE